MCDHHEQQNITTAMQSTHQATGCQELDLTQLLVLQMSWQKYFKQKVGANSTTLKRNIYHDDESDQSMLILMSWHDGVHVFSIYEI
mmetsp:Transcript_53391/g.159822  ORF Transcript_53391/g.159822 Transcript_53391/m.159822 type:complete len:86 (+) Transcript_53391:166-423(+)